MDKSDPLQNPSEISLETFSHKPVLLSEMLHFLQPLPSEIYVDATFGGGGYTQAILEATECRVIALDRDLDALPRSLPFKKKWQERFDFLQGPFSCLQPLLKGLDISCVDGIVFDLGMSSYQLDQAERGFSFLREGPLDMRMTGEGKSAYDVIQEASESELADTFYHYGEERKARPLARALVEHRKMHPLHTTTQLATLIERVIPRRPSSSRSSHIHPATKAFQALRIFVNDELKELHEALNVSLSLLKPNGRLIVVSFHSLEDRIVKQFLKGTHVSSQSSATEASQHSLFDILTPKPLTPSPAELSSNPRARSAKLRAARKK